MQSGRGAGRFCFPRAATRCLAAWGSACLLVAVAHADARPGAYPALSTEISAEHPLFLFHADDPADGDTTLYISHLQEAWDTLPEPLRPYSALVIDVPGVDPASRHERNLTVLQACQEYGVPVVVTVADGNPKRFYPIASLEALLEAYTCVRGAAVLGMRFNEYDEAEAGPALGPPTRVRWLAGTMETLARYGRFCWMPLDEIGWPRAMANAQCAALYEQMRACRGYVLPGAACRGQHVVPQVAACLGLWLEDAAAHWGTAPDAQWYADARFDGPGRFGGPGTSGSMPSGLYRAMILVGAMAGATVYAFPSERDLWFGREVDRWNDAIYPSLLDLLEKGLIARRDFVQERAPVAFQLAHAATGRAFHANLRHIDGVLDQGWLVHGAYGMERPGQVPELIPNRGDRFIVPLISPHAPEESLAAFARVVQPHELQSAAEWSALLDAHAAPAGEGTAFITRVGRGIFILNSRENIADAQTFRVAEAPAPLRGVTARREGETVVIAWPFREGDVSYKVYRRVPPETRHTLIATLLDERQFTDASPPPFETAVYAVTALTTDTEPFEGVVGHGEYLALSTVESRIAEEVMLAPTLTYGEAEPAGGAGVAGTVSWTPWWPNTGGLAVAEQRMAEAIARRIEEWDAATSAKDLAAVMSLYAEDYRDPQGWGAEYARRAWQWFFERFAFPRMHRQIRQWDFSAFEEVGRVRVLLYARFTAYAPTDSTGRVADVPVHFPRVEAGETWVTFETVDGQWRIVHTDPALPNFRDFLAHTAGPETDARPGADVYPIPVLEPLSP